MQIVYYLSSPEEEGDKLKVGYAGCAENEYEPFKEEVVKTEEDDDDDGPAKMPKGAAQPAGSGPATSEGKAAEPVAPGTTRSGLYRGRVKVPKSTGKKRKFTRADLAGMKLHKSEQGDVEGGSSVAGGQRKVPKKGLSLVDESDSDGQEEEAEKTTAWADDLVLDDLAGRDVPGGSGSDPLIVENDGSIPAPPVLRPTPIRAIPAVVEVDAEVSAGDGSKAPGKQPLEGNQENPDFGGFLDSLLPADCSDPLRGVSDKDAFVRSDESLVYHLRWALDTRRRYRAAYNDRETLRSELEIEQGHVSEMKRELDVLKEEKKSWSKLTDEVINLRATDQNQQATIAELRMTIEGLKADLFNRNLQVEEQENRINEIEDKMGEQGGVILAKNQEIIALQASQVSAEESLAAALEQVKAERDAKERLVADLAKLRAGLGVIGDKVLKEPGVAEPVNAYAFGMLEYGSHRAAVRAQKAFEKNPPELPEDLLQMIKPDSKGRTKQLFEALKNAKSAYAAKLAESSELSVDELLALEP